MIGITDYITNDFKAINNQDTIAVVQEFFNDVHFSHFPIIEEGVYLGSIAREDLETFDSTKKVSDFRYSLEGFFTRTNTIWLDVLEVFAKNQTNLVPVLDENNTYVGYYQIEDIMKFFHETPFLKEPGGVIVVKKAALDYSMSQITQIVESNNGKLLGVFVSELDVESVEVTLKITLGAINEIIQTFRRYDYEIISEHQEDNYINNLKERSDYLDKYLNI
ncbi:CBS domain-containing protein [Flavobacterium sp. RSP49]|uniref:CBS domain-containing protein n=1 Tax=unclassified Flavobacterium TaxID=196869 RepID=UPI000F842947|nr:MULTISPECIES: CBS domain-containing protein [unclassified Flavobacterium]RTY71441.1 CBS domain-containing protein [Flavobacterium sp. LB2P53]RTZ00310.1 CBS domain-containing protein [Flavobacterium sp. RSP49]RTZ08478.1 CBS domain-containing protein [Flavobacterium sp. GSP6]